MEQFEVVRTLGRGAFASVFYVRQRSDGTDLVVKKFHRPMDELSARERQEVRRPRAVFLVPRLAPHAPPPPSPGSPTTGAAFRWW